MVQRMRQAPAHAGVSRTCTKQAGVGAGARVSPKGVHAPAWWLSVDGGAVHATPATARHRRTHEPVPTTAGH
jgi:hypothetical protein